MTTERVQPTTGVEGVPPSVRAQILATEHWSLLATRSMTWSEVMSRITIHLTVSSAALVVLALVVQADGFGTAFDVLSIGLASAVLVLGSLTAVRINSASHDDARLLLGMNRLRAAYIELDPTLPRYLVTSWYDDLAGLDQSYWMGSRRHRASHVVGSTAFFLAVVNAIVAGTLGALVTGVSGGSWVMMTVVGVASGVAYAAAMLEVGRRGFGGGPPDVRFPSPGVPT